MRTEIKRLHERLGTSIVYVTHDQIEAMTLATKVAVMKGGHIQQFADPRTIYERPANVFVASFIGSPAMNFLPGRLVSDANGVRFASGGVSVALQAGKRPVQSERPVILGIRPEELKVVGRDEASVTGVIDVVEPTGPETMVTVQVGEQSIIARLQPRFTGRRNEPIFLAVDPASVNLFDPGNEQRIDI